MYRPKRIVTAYLHGKICRRHSHNLSQNGQNSIIVMFIRQDRLVTCATQTVATANASTQSTQNQSLVNRTTHRHRHRVLAYYNPYLRWTGQWIVTTPPTSEMAPFSRACTFRSTFSASQIGAHQRSFFSA